MPSCATPSFPPRVTPDARQAHHRSSLNRGNVHRHPKHPLRQPGDPIKPLLRGSIKKTQATERTQTGTLIGRSRKPLPTGSSVIPTSSMNRSKTSCRAHLSTLKVGVWSPPIWTFRPGASPRANRSQRERPRRNHSRRPHRSRIPRRARTPRCSTHRPWQPGGGKGRRTRSGNGR